MPNRTGYRARHYPPDWSDHLFAHGLPVAVYLGALMMGGLSLASLILPPIIWAPAIELLPPWAGFIVAAALLVGGGASLAGVFAPLQCDTLAAAARQAGALAQAIGWTLWGAAAWVAPPPPYGTAVIVGIALGVGNGLDFVASLLSASDTGVREWVDRIREQEAHQ